MQVKRVIRLLATLLVASGLSTVSSLAHAACPFNPDGAGTAAGTATTDGLRFIRYALGATAGSGLGANATEGTALPAAVASYIADATNNAAIDIDGNGQFEPRDAMVIARYLMGFRGLALGVGLPDAQFANRFDGTAFQTYINAGCSNLSDKPDPRAVVWNAMNAALVAGNAATAKTYLTGLGVANHGAAIDSLLNQMPAIVAS